MPKSLPILFLVFLVVAGGGGFYLYQQNRQLAYEDINLADLKSELDAFKETLNPEPLRRLDGESGTLTADGVLQHTNERRILEDLSPLTGNRLLDQAAKNKLDDMFARQYFDHVSPTGEQPSEGVEAVGYEYVRTGENLALGNFGSDRDLVQAWMDSPGHRENILKEGFEEIGIAVERGIFDGNQVWIGVQMFAKPLSSCPDVDLSLQVELENLIASLEQDNSSLVAQQEEIDTRKKELAQLSQQISQLIKEGNEQIKKGNEVAQEEGNEAAQPYWDAGKAKHEQAQELQTSYDQQQEELNRQVDNFNQAIKEQNQDSDRADKLAQRYNAQVRALNACLKQ